MESFYRDNQIGGMQISVTNTPLKDCEFIQAGEWRLFYEPNKSEGNGFNAVAVTFGNCPGDSVPFELDTEINDKIEITAHFDGVRHLHFNHGTNDLGYLYYPSDLIKLFTVLNELTKKFCSMVDKDDFL